MVRWWRARSLRVGEADAEARAAGRYRLESVIEAVGEQDLLDQGETDPLAVGLGAVEGSEQPGCDLGRNAASAVLDHQQRYVLLHRERGRDVALGADRIDRVAHDIDERLLHLTAIHPH